MRNFIHFTHIPHDIIKLSCQHKLYPALFEYAENHIAVIRALAQKWKGMSRLEIIEAAKLPDGGGLTDVLVELTGSGFISSYYPFGIRKNEHSIGLIDSEVSLDELFAT